MGRFPVNKAENHQRKRTAGIDAEPNVAVSVDAASMQPT
jgi:hypothetical protein